MKDLLVRFLYGKISMGILEDISPRMFPLQRTELDEMRGLHHQIES